ncbi:cellulase family glycosylhydrolase [Leptospira perolatii]|uniref:cellulase family glycosylhydrolase n=1 Tax=Leptospira perolatii TaxID=2023191 RepID=UPI001FAEAE18|nr:cellulase family glycosylhydrolase [Leptospira perolatii]
MNSFQDLNTFGHTAQFEAGSHNFDYVNSPGSASIFISQKSYGNNTDQIYVDGLGREVAFRGFNISGNTKLVQHQFKPFQNEQDAEIAMDRLAKSTGSNIVRFAIAWEGVHPSVGSIDTAYVSSVVAQMKKAISRKMYILVDYHQDLFSRHLFNQNSWFTANGAPRWITPEGSYPNEYCGIICANWSQNNLTNEAIRKAFRNFWNNAGLTTSLGPRLMQDEFIWQLGQAAQFLKDHLSPEEFSYVLGLDPFNEPVDGGMQGLTPAQWDNQKLWPFYQRVRQELNSKGWQDKWVFAEPLVFWNTNVGSAIVPATGGGHLSSPPGPGFVFNSHFYDAARMGWDVTGIDNATYFKYLDEIRKEGRFLNTPIFLSEFGMWLNGAGAKDTPRMISAVYQAMEISDGQQTSKTRFADFYNPIVSGTQWQWDYYHNQHHEFMNGNLSKLITSKDAWNDEEFSVIGNSGSNFNMDFHAIQRSYPRRSQGRILSFYYNAVGFDSWNNIYKWGGIRTSSTGPTRFSNNRFSILIWKGRNSDSPSEIYLPPHFSRSELILVTEKRVYNKNLNDAIGDQSDEAVIVSDFGRQSGSGDLLVLWDDLDPTEDGAESVHYALVIDGTGLNLSESYLSGLQLELNQRILSERKSPIFLTGKMTYGGYPSE